MAFTLRATGVAKRRFLGAFSQAVAAAPPSKLALAVAYGSVYGVQRIIELADQFAIEGVAWITDVRDAVTHPLALRIAVDQGWTVRIVNGTNTFHPKVYIGCDAVGDDGEVAGVRWVAFSSANLSAGGFRDNVEASFFGAGGVYQGQAAATYKALWDCGTALDPAWIDDYQKYFYDRNRRRSVEDLKTLGIPDALPADLQPNRKPSPPSPKIASATPVGAVASWAGLESFTGEYRFQVEFPRSAGEVLGNMLATAGHAGHTEMRCSDGEKRPVTFRFYPDNSMFRLNIPNETPNIQWVRENKAGIAVVGVDPSDPNEFLLRILRPGEELDSLVGRSAALGTWGKTPTRLYGWY